jgi:hypothetical protein
LDHLEKLKSFQFIVEARYDANTATFRAAIGFNDLTDQYGKSLSIGNANPDIIQTLPPRNSNTLQFVGN